MQPISCLQVQLMFFPFHNTAQKECLCHFSASKTTYRDLGCYPGRVDPMTMNSPAASLQRNRMHPGAGQKGMKKGSDMKTVKWLRSRGSRSAYNEVVASEPAHAGWAMRERDSKRKWHWTFQEAETIHLWSWPEDIYSANKLRATVTRSLRLRTPSQVVI